MLHSLQRENIHILLYIKILLSNLDKKQTLKKFYKSYYNKRNDRKKII